MSCDSSVWVRGVAVPREDLTNGEVSAGKTNRPIRWS